jgi:hypothetical protein
VLEIVLHGVAQFSLVPYLGVGGLTGAGGSSLQNCLYFSAKTFSSLGFAT